MKSVKVEEILKNKEKYPLLYLRNYSKVSVKHAYKPVCVITTGEDKGKLLLARWSNCAQVVIEPQTNLYCE